MRKQIVYVIAFLAILGIPALRAESAATPQELIVSAAASLTNAFQEIGKKFESAHTDAKIIFNFGASGALLQQIEKGAPVDVFASADQKTLDQAGEKKLILPDTRKDFASNSLVLVVPTGSKISIKSSEDLLAKDVTRVSLGNPEAVPAGRYTQDALSSEGIWEALKPKFINGGSVRQVLDYVSRGEVDAGFVYATDAATAGDKVQVAVVMEKHKPILYPIAVVAATQQKDLSQRFIDFILGQEGQEILAKYGFGKP